MYNHPAMLNIVNAKNFSGQQVALKTAIHPKSNPLLDRGVNLDSDFEVDGTMCFENSILKVDAKVIVKLTCNCDNCLKIFNKNFSFRLQEEFANPDVKLPEQYDLNLNNIDLEKPIIDNFLLSFPTKILCKKNCKGLCEICGKNLNEQSCGCKEIFSQQMANENPFKKLI